MIKVNYTKENDYYKKIEVLGHSLYDDLGKDIVCSAVSSITTTSVNAVIRLNEKTIKYMISSKGLVIDILEEDYVTNTLMDNMINLLKELETDYPKNISVNKEEIR